MLEHFRSLNWDTAKLHDTSPFQVVPPGFNAILLAAFCAIPQPCVASHTPWTSAMMASAIGASLSVWW